MRHTDPYLTAEALGIAPETRAGLIQLRDELLDGRLPWAPANRFRKENRPRNLSAFNMYYGWCGTVGCLMGHLIYRDQLRYNSTDPAGLAELFRGFGHGEPEWHDLTPEQTAAAIERYLTTGDSREMRQDG